VCNNAPAQKRTTRRIPIMLNVRITQVQRVLLWLVLIALAALVTYLGIRGYFSPEMLFNFSNSFYC
jgi:hypothetical protein